MTHHWIPLVKRSRKIAKLTHSGERAMNDRGYNEIPHLPNVIANQQWRQLVAWQQSLTGPFFPTHIQYGVIERQIQMAVGYNFLI